MTEQSSPENAIEWIGRSAAPLHAALKKYPDAFEALHFLFNEMNYAQCVPNQPTEAMLDAARDWSVAKFGRGIGNDAAIGCWQVMLAAALVRSDGK